MMFCLGVPFFSLMLTAMTFAMLSSLKNNAFVNQPTAGINRPFC